MEKKGYFLVGDRNPKGTCGWSINKKELEKIAKGRNQHGGTNYRVISEDEYEVSFS